jgi:hypothetical protein
MRNFMIVIALAACSSQPVDNSDQLDAPVGKADAAARPSGTYTNATPHYGEFNVVTLNDDFTFSRYQLGACAGGGTCAPALVTGTYLFTHSSTRHYIRFYDDTGSALDRYQWKLSGSTLSLNYEGNDHWFALAQQNACETAGGTCVALAPDTCPNGTTGGYSCGGGLGVTCCMPQQSSNQCTADTDCSGFLPQYCRMCGDGSESCAHWSCVESTCQIVTCQ